MIDPSTPAAPLSNELLKVVFTIVVTSLATWLIAAWKNGRAATVKVDSEAVARSLITPVQTSLDQMRVEMDRRFDELDKDQEKRDMAQRQLEFVVLGVNGRGGLVESAERQRVDHELLLHAITLVRELYRTVTAKEPPPPPAAVSEIHP